MRGIRARHARLEPFLDKRRHKGCARAGQRDVAAAVVKQEFHQFSVAQGAEALRDPGWTVRGRRTRQPERPSGIGQELRVVEQLGGSRQTEHERIGRKAHELVVGFVVLEIIVVILQEERWRRTQRRAVKIGDLRARRPLQHLLVARAEHRLRAVEDTGKRDRLLRHAEAIGAHRAQIPVNVIAIGDDCIRRE